MTHAKKKLPSNTNTPAMAVPVIAIVGGINMDLIYETDRTPDLSESKDSASLVYCTGGKGANTAIATYRACHVKAVGDGSIFNRARAAEGKAAMSDIDKKKIDVYMNGSVGDDEFGKELKAKLEQNGVNVSGVRTVEGEKSGTCCVIVETDTGESRNLAYQGANLKWKPRDEDSVECLAGGAKPDLIVTHLGIPREVIEDVLERAGRRGVDTLLNPSPASYLISSTYKNLTHLLMNETESAMLSDHDIHEFKDLAAWKKAAAGFIKLGVKNVVITLGSKGAYYATHRGEKGLVEAEKNVKVADSTGAGYATVAVP